MNKTNHLLLANESLISTSSIKKSFIYWLWIVYLRSQDLYKNVVKRLFRTGFKFKNNKSNTNSLKMIIIRPQFTVEIEIIQINIYKIITRISITYWSSDSLIFYIENKTKPIEGLRNRFLR